MFFRNDEGPGDAGKAPRRVLPLLPLRDIVVYPHAVVPLFVGRPKSIRALEEAVAGNRELVLSAQRDHTTEEPREEDVFRVGTLGAIIQLLRLPDQTVKVLVEGQGARRDQALRRRASLTSRSRWSRCPTARTKGAEAQALRAQPAARPSRTTSS